MKNRETVLKYYENFENGNLTEDLFTKDFHFTGVIEGFKSMNAVQFVQEFNQLSQLLKNAKLNHVIEDNEKIFVSLDFFSTMPEVVPTRFADLFICEMGKIKELITHFDPRAFFSLPQFQQ